MDISLFRNLVNLIGITQSTKQVFLGKLMSDSTVGFRYCTNKSEIAINPTQKGSLDVCFQTLKPDYIDQCKEQFTKLDYKIIYRALNKISLEESAEYLETETLDLMAQSLVSRTGWSEAKEREDFFLQVQLQDSLKSPEGKQLNEMKSFDGYVKHMFYWMHKLPLNSRFLLAELRLVTEKLKMTEDGDDSLRFRVITLKNYFLQNTITFFYFQSKREKTMSGDIKGLLQSLINEKLEFIVKEAIQKKSMRSDFILNCESLFDLIKTFCYTNYIAFYSSKDELKYAKKRSVEGGFVKCKEHGDGINNEFLFRVKLPKINSEFVNQSRNLDSLVDVDHFVIHIPLINDQDSSKTVQKLSEFINILFEIHEYNHRAKVYQKLQLQNGYSHKMKNIEDLVCTKLQSASNFIKGLNIEGDKKNKADELINSIDKLRVNIKDKNNYSYLLRHYNTDSVKGHSVKVDIIGIIESTFEELRIIHSYNDELRQDFEPRYIKRLQNFYIPHKDAEEIFEHFIFEILINYFKYRGEKVLYLSYTDNNLLTISNKAKKRQVDEECKYDDFFECNDMNTQKHLYLLGSKLLNVIITKKTERISQMYKLEIDLSKLEYKLGV